MYILTALLAFADYSKVNQFLINHTFDCSQQSLVGFGQ